MPPQGKQGAPTGTIHLSPARQKRNRKRRTAEERRWAAKNGPVTITRMCGATDGASLVGDGPDDLDEPYGRCTLPLGHDTGGWHQEWRDGRVWAEWRGPAPGERCRICGRDGSEH